MNTAIISSPIRLLLIALSILVLTACSGVNISGDKKTAPVLFSDFTENATFLLKQAELANEADSTEWELSAIQALIRENQYLLADSVIEHLQKKVSSPQQKNNLSLLIAGNQYAQNQVPESLQSLQQVDESLLSEAGRLYYLKLKVDIEIRNKDHQAASDTLLILTPLLTEDEEKQQYNDILLTQLAALPRDVLNKFKPVAVTSTSSVSGAQATDAPVSSDDKFAAELAKIEAEMKAERTGEPEPVALSEEEVFVQGWYALASLYQQYQLRTHQLIQALDAWELAYPTHPVLEFMPTQLVNIPEAAPYQPTKIAVLLPLSGRFKAQAQALQYGISHAYYQQQKNKAEQFTQEQSELQSTQTVNSDDAANQENQPINAGITPAESTQNEQSTINAQTIELPATPYLQFFDTNKMSMSDIAQQLHEQDVEFVIGPLLKPNLAALLPLIENIPVLALNGFPTQQETNQDAIYEGSPLHYAFPLSPENEAKQAAEMIFDSKHKKPLLMVPNSHFGRRVSQAFEHHWAELHDQQDSELNNQLVHYPAETHYFSDKAQFARFVDTAMQTDSSKQRINQMQAIAQQKLETEVRSRRDIDAIYIVSNRGELILLKPFIAVTTSQFAKRIPLYASSRSHADDKTQTQNKELSGLTFSDITFLMNNSDEVRLEVDKLLPKQRMGTLRLFALGFDSYNLIEQLKQLQVIEGYRFQGLVGELSLDQKNTINSTLQWGKYQRGELVEITTSAPSQ